MKMYRLCLFMLAASAPLVGCAAVVPQELVSARAAYHRASTGPAAQSKPAEVHKASVALSQAEQSFANEPTSYQTRDLAYVAERKAQLAEALAEIASDEATIAKADADYMSTQTQMVKQSKADLTQSQEALAASERGGQKTAERLAAEKKSRLEGEQRSAQAQALTAGQLAEEKAAREISDKRAADATAALADLAAKEEARGLVITLSGSVLFASDQSMLLPSAQSRLGQVADALLANKQRTVIIEGHSDSRGSDSHNIDLSMRRAESVRSFMISKGYDASRISAQGIGRSRPIADNKTAEGRANNRRVEIVVVPLAKR